MSLSAANNSTTSTENVWNVRTTQMAKPVPRKDAENWPAVHEERLQSSEQQRNKSREKGVDGSAISANGKAGNKKKWIRIDADITVGTNPKAKDAAAPPKRASPGAAAKSGKKTPPLGSHGRKKKDSDTLSTASTPVKSASASTSPTSSKPDDVSDSTTLDLTQVKDAIDDVAAESAPESVDAPKEDATEDKDKAKPTYPNGYQGNNFNAHYYASRGGFRGRGNFRNTARGGYNRFNNFQRGAYGQAYAPFPVASGQPPAEGIEGAAVYGYPPQYMINGEFQYPYYAAMGPQQPYVDPSLFYSGYAYPGGFVPPPPGGAAIPPYMAQIPGPFAPAPQPSDLSNQIAYYFSVDNLCRDMYLRQQMDSEGWVPIKTIADFKRVKLSGADFAAVKEAMLAAPTLQVQDDKVRLKENWQNWTLSASSQ